MLENMEGEFLDVTIERVRKRTNTRMFSSYTRNTYNLPYFMSKLIDDYILDNKTTKETVVVIEIKEAENQQHCMY
jgi:hypothetical protein